MTYGHALSILDSLRCSVCHADNGVVRHEGKLYCAACEIKRQDAEDKAAQTKAQKGPEGGYTMICTSCGQTIHDPRTASKDATGDYFCRDCTAVINGAPLDDKGNLIRTQPQKGKEA